jgi:transposase InsO family protein
VRFEFIASQASEKEFPVDYMCRMLDVTRPGYYQWLKRGASQRDRDDAALLVSITAIFELHKKRYGVRRVHAELRRSGTRVAYKRVQRLMSEAGLVSVHPRPWRKTTVQAGPCDLPDLVGRQFNPPRPNMLWYGDITYVKTWEGWAYIASVIDAHSRKVVGWAIDNHMRTDLVEAALRMAIEQRDPPDGVIFHTDRGSQYTSARFVGFCKENGVRNSVGRTGICYDNSAAESFWATLKKELIHLRPWDTLGRLRREVFEYIECYYNRMRIHSSLDYLTPIEYELQHELCQGKVA